MKIRYVTGDLLDGDEVLIVHGCNAHGKFESGLAGVIRRRLPFAYAAYRDAFDDTAREFTLGNVIWGFDIGNQIRPRIVGNMITQDDYGRVPGRVYVDYDAVNIALRNLNHFVGQTQDGAIEINEIGPIGSVGFPLVGTGLGGGSWKTISQIIERQSVCFEPVVYTLDGFIPN
jgi:O-acetyl-ADP-ribose deacetylase (regulator of RNase III)